VLDLVQISAPLRALLHKLGDGQSPFDLLATDQGRFPGVTEAQLHVTNDCRLPKEALAGLLLYAGFGGQSHNIAQSCGSKEGHYWHGIYHRMEPDEWNSMYWLKQVGHHEIEAPLAKRAAALGFGDGRNWNHQAFVDWVSKARQQGDKKEIEKAKMIQLAEWQLLFGWCAGSVGREGSASR
jgi:hypothetical protein